MARGVWPANSTRSLSDRSMCPVSKTIEVTITLGTGDSQSVETKSCERKSWNSRFLRHSERKPTRSRVGVSDNMPQQSTCDKQLLCELLDVSTSL